MKQPVEGQFPKQSAIVDIAISVEEASNFRASASSKRYPEAQRKVLGVVQMVKTHRKKNTS
jgi:hypothetical protein